MNEYFLYRIQFLIKGLFILPLGVFGIMHFINPGFFTHMAPNYAPNADFWVFVSGICLLGTSLAIFFDLYIKVASILLFLFVCVFIVSVDIPNVIHTSNQQQYFITSLLKDISLLGGTSFILFLEQQKDKVYH